MLHHHIQRTSQDVTTSYTMHGHVGAILILIASVAKKQSYHILPYIDLLTEQPLQKWVTQFNNSTKFLVSSNIICLLRYKYICFCNFSVEN